MRRAQTFAVALCVLLTGLAWANLIDLEWRGGLLVVVPVLVASTAAAAFFRRLWAAVALRAALWGSFLWCSVIVIGSTEYEDRALTLPVCFAAGAGLLLLGRFSRTLGGARPLLVALAALALADAITHGLLAAFILVEANGNDERVAGALAFIALANAMGLAFILRATVVWPHIVGNAIVMGIAAVDLLDAPFLLNAAIGGAALLQIVLAALLRAPRASPELRRFGERTLRVAIVLTLIADVIVTVTS